MKAITRSGFIALFLFSGIVMNAQEGFFRESGWAFGYGQRFITNEFFSNTDYLDFLNYLYQDDEGFEYDYIDLDIWFTMHNGLDFSFQIATYDDFKINSLNLKLGYELTKHLGVSAGYYSFPQLLNSYDTWYDDRNEALIEFDSNFRQEELLDRGAMVGVFFKFDFHALHLRADLNSGLTFLSTIEVDVNRRAEYSTYKERDEYVTKSSFTPFFLPEIRLGVDLFSTPFKTVGFQVHSSWMRLNRALDYEYTHYVLSYDDPHIEQVENPKHSFSKLDIDAGLYLRF